MKANNLIHKFKRMHTILVKNPAPRSFAAFVRYKMWLANLENVTLQSKWMELRYEVLSAKQKEGPLTCEYCGKSGLMIYTADNDKLATLDHIVAIAQGGGRFDVDNLCVACYDCNAKKADLPLEVFKKCISQRTSASRTTI